MFLSLQANSVAVLAPQVVITPHVYPPSITGATFLAKDLWEQSRVAFGYLQAPGYCGTPMAQTEADSTVSTQSINSESVSASIAAVVGRRLRKLLSRHAMHRPNGTTVHSPNSTIPALNGTATLNSTATLNITTNSTANSTTNGTVVPVPEAPADGRVVPRDPPRQAGCTVFPVVIGETGSNFQSATDRAWLGDFADFITAKVRRAVVQQEGTAVLLRCSCKAR